MASWWIIFDYPKNVCDQLKLRLPIARWEQDVFCYQSNNSNAYGELFD